jgi:site-specific recombinase XerD/ribosomal protein S27AE
MGFHKGWERLNTQLRLLDKLPEDNRVILKEFSEFLISEGISPLRILRYVQIMRLVSEWVDVPLKEWDKSQILDVLVRLEKSDYKVGTKNEFRKALKRFFRWYRGEDWDGLRLLKRVKENNRIPEVLTEEEVFRMIEVATNERDKAMIAVWYEAGLRVAEIATLRIKDVEWQKGDEIKAKIKVRGKTGERVIPLVVSAPYLKRWLEVHPFKENLDAIVFCSFAKMNFGGMIDYQPLLRKIKSIAKKAGIHKKVSTHTLRHSRATVLANFLTEAQMCQYFGWIQGSNMPKVYVHLSGRDIDDAIDRIYGLRKEEDSKVVKPRACPRCGHINAPTDRFCGRCALILDEAERIRFESDGYVIETMMELLREDPEIFNKAKLMIDFAKKLKEDYDLLKSFVESV